MGGDADGGTGAILSDRCASEYIYNIAFLSSFILFSQLFRSVLAFDRMVYLVIDHREDEVMTNLLPVPTSLSSDCSVYHQI